MITTMQTFRSADELLSFLKGEKEFDASAPIDVDKVAELLSIRVRYKPQSDGIVGSISLQDGKAIVTINPFENSYEPRRRFTLAHEIGHFCLHLSESRDEFIDTRKTMTRQGSFWNILESEANAFAADLLMPFNQIILVGNEVIADYRKNEKAEKMPTEAFTAQMASIFKVSNPAMEYRLKNLGVLK